MKKIIPVFFLMLIFSQKAITSDLKPYEAVYKTELGGFDVKVKRCLQIEDSSLIINVDAKRFIFGIDETSKLLDQGGGQLSSRYYEHKRSGLTHKHDKELIFDWSNNTVIDLLEPNRPPLSVEEPTYDKLGYQVQMRLDLIRNPGLRHLEYAVTNGIRNRTYTFDYLDEEILETPLGKLRTLKFSRTGDDDDREVVVWVAPDWDFLLVRIDQTREPGEKTEQMIIKKAEIGGRKVTGM